MLPATLYEREVVAAATDHRKMLREQNDAGRRTRIKDTDRNPSIKKERKNEAASTISAHNRCRGGLGWAGLGWGDQTKRIKFPSRVAAPTTAARKDRDGLLACLPTGHRTIIRVNEVILIKIYIRRLTSQGFRRAVGRSVGRSNGLTTVALAMLHKRTVPLASGSTPRPAIAARTRDAFTFSKSAAEAFKRRLVGSAAT